MGQAHPAPATSSCQTSSTIRNTVGVATSTSSPVGVLPSPFYSSSPPARSSSCLISSLTCFAGSNHPHRRGRHGQQDRFCRGCGEDKCRSGPPHAKWRLPRQYLRHCSGCIRVLGPWILDLGTFVAIGQTLFSR